MKYKDESGNVVIEASIVMTIAVVMVAVLLNLGILLYNRNLMETMAMQAATDVANVYSTTFRDPMYGYIDDSEFFKKNLYRHIADVFTSSHENATERKTEWFALYSLKKNEVSRIKDLTVVDVDVVRKPGTVLQRQVVIKLKGTFDAPLTAIWGGNNKATYIVEGRADCIDLLDYFSSVSTMKDCVLSKVDKFTKDISKIIGIFDLSSLEG